MTLTQSKLEVLDAANFPDKVAYFFLGGISGKFGDVEML